MFIKIYKTRLEKKKKNLPIQILILRERRDKERDDDVNRMPRAKEEQIPVSLFIVWVTNSKISRYFCFSVFLFVFIDLKEPRNN